MDPEVHYFRYLNRLRSGGRTNMYGAVPYLVRAFGIGRESAFEVICRWIDAFEENRSAEAPEAPAPVVVHRPRRSSRARPPADRKPLPAVEIRVTKPAPGRNSDARPRPPRKPKPRRR